MRHGVAGAVEAIYEAAASPAVWPDALAALAALTEANAAILCVGPKTTELTPLATCGLGGFDPGVLTGDLAASLVARLGASPVGTLVTTSLSDLPEALMGCSTDSRSGDSRANGSPVPGSPLSRGRRHDVGRSGAPAGPGTPDDALAAFASAADAGEMAGLCLLHEPGAVAALWLFRPRGKPFDAAAIDHLRDLESHLSRALAIHLRVERAERQAAEARDAFDRVALGTVLVDEDARPILANRAAKRIAAQQDGFVIGLDGLRGGTPADSRALQRAIAEVARGGTGTGLGLRLARSSSSRPYEVMVVPISRGKRWPSRLRRTAIVFISDCGLSFASPARLVHDLYGLTAAETRLALLLLGGQSMHDAATTLGVSRNTAHSQLASIFRKTDTTSQAELVRVLLRGPGAVRVPGDSSDAYPKVENEP